MNPCAWQQEVMDSKAYYKVVIAGRRVGKDVYIALDGYRQAMKQGKRVMAICPNDHMANQLWRTFRDYEATQPNTYLRRPGYFQVVTAALLSSAELRENNPSHILVNEPALCQRWLWVEILEPYHRTRPCTLTFLGTPLTYDWFVALGQKGFDPDNGGWQTWRLPTTANPYISLESLEHFQQEMSETVYRQEILAELTEEVK